MEKNKLDRAQRRKITLPLSFLICVSVLTLCAAVMARWLPGVANSLSKQPQAAAAQATIPQMLQDINNRLDPRTSAYLNARRATLLREQLDLQMSAMPPSNFLDTDINYAGELLNAGKTDEALREYRS